MLLLEWNSSYETGIGALDAEHRRLIDLINALHTELEGSADEASVSAFFGDLYAEISAHFALEERMMRERRYAGYPSHKADHELLLEEIRDLMDLFEGQGGRPDRGHVGRKLDEWFSRHFRTMDAAFQRAIDNG